MTIYQIGAVLALPYHRADDTVIAALIVCEVARSTLYAMGASVFDPKILTVFTLLLRNISRFARKPRLLYLLSLQKSPYQSQGQLCLSIL